MKRLATFGMMTLLAFVSGCGDEAITQQADLMLYPVMGRVKVGKQPLPGMIVTLKPKFDWKENVPHPHATTAEDSTFEIETLMSGDGAPAGEYQVGVVPLSDVRGGTASSAGEGAYADPAKSGLTTVVKAQPTMLPDIVLKSSGIRPLATKKKRRD